MTRVANSKSRWIVTALIAGAVILVYARVFGAGFIWDDDDHLTKNPCIVGPLGFADIWTSVHAVYYPLVLTTFWAIHKLAGLNPAPYHILNVVVHAGSVLLLWRVLEQLKVRGAWLGAALWALHPVMVQSVAWVTELKNTQSCFFYLLSILFFLKKDSSETERKKRWLLVLSILCFVGAITSKTSTVMLPFILGLCLWWRNRRLRLRDVAGLGPFLLISAAASGWTIWEQRFHSGALGAEWDQSWPQRLAIAGWDLWFYLGKLLWPHPLVFIYPRWDLSRMDWIAFLPSCAAAVGLFLLWRLRDGRLRPVFLAAACFVVSLFPVLGFFNVYFFRYSFVSDHFQYLASMGPLAVLGAGLTNTRDLLNTRVQWLGFATRAALLGVLGLLTWGQTGIYRDVETLYRNEIARNPACWLAHNNLGIVYFKEKKLDEAIASYRKALEIKPEYAEAYNNIGNCFIEGGDFEQGVAYCTRALELKPFYPEALGNLGAAFVGDGRLDEGITRFEEALKLKPDFAEAESAIGFALVKKGLTKEAREHLERALKIDPNLPEAHNNLGSALEKEGKLEGAIGQYERAIQLSPDLAEAYSNLGNALVREGRTDEGIRRYRKALELKPNYGAANSNLAFALLQKGSIDEAITLCEKAIALQPNLPEPHCNLGQALMGKNDDSQAAAQFEKALELKPDYTEALYNLGLLQLRDKKIAEAIQLFQRVLELRPYYAEAEYNLGRALLDQGDMNGAINHFVSATLIEPQNPAVPNEIAWLLATSDKAEKRNGAKAIEFAQQASKLSAHEPAILDTLAAAYAERGDFENAVEAAMRALDLATQTANEPLRKEIGQRLELYQHRRPYRER